MVNSTKNDDKTTKLVWLQREFRLSALPTLQAALESPGLVIVVYFHDPKYVIGEANSLWMAHSLKQLQSDIKEKGGFLWIVSGDFETQFESLLTKYTIQEVLYSFQVGYPFNSLQDKALEICKKHKVALQPNYSEFLIEPENIHNQQNKPYVVFTPFYKALLAKQTLIMPLQEELEGLERCGQLQPVDQAWLELPLDLQHLMKKT